MSDSPDVFAEIEAGLEKHRPGANPSWCVACSDFDTMHHWPCDAHRALTGWKKAEEEKRALVTAVLDVADSTFRDDDNGPGDYTCQMCHASEPATWKNGMNAGPVKPLTHAAGCPRTLALLAAKESK